MPLSSHTAPVSAGGGTLSVSQPEGAPILGLSKSRPPRTQKEGGAKRPVSAGAVTASPSGMKRDPPVHEDEQGHGRDEVESHDHPLALLTSP